MGVCEPDARDGRTDGLRVYRLGALPPDPQQYLEPEEDRVRFPASSG